MTPPTLFIAAALATVCAWPSAAAPPDNRPQTVVFSWYAPLSNTLEMARRLLSPLTAAAIADQLTAAGKALAAQSIDLKAERFRIYVPTTPPAAGYGLLVFIPPWDDDHIPPGWPEVLEARGVIFVSAANSGNAANPFRRREPLALLAADNVMRRYKVDPAHVYISGFSGGSRVALRLALGYPDLFAGAWLDAGADPVGGPDLPLPPRPLFDRFRTSSMIEYFAGTADEVPRQQQDASMASLRRWCVANVAVRSKLDLGHDIAPASALALALGDLDKPRRAPTAKEAACWERVTREADEALDRAEAAMARSDLNVAKSTLNEIDRRFGGLASPRIIELAGKLAKASASASGR
jgi:dienelactone hydrolase